MSTETDYERGLKEGRVDALLEEHTARLNKINGSVDRFTKAVEAQSKEMRSLASDIRSLQEQQRLSEERVKVAADVLATETERRREELANVGTRWSLLSNKATILYALCAVFFGFATLYLAIHYR